MLLYSSEKEESEKKLNIPSDVDLYHFFCDL